MDCFVAIALRNDGVGFRFKISNNARTNVRILAAHYARALPEISLPSPIQRAQGMPDARCTRDLMRNVHKKCAHEHTGQRRTSDIPCAMALRLITRSPR